ncbi:MAG: hypothetical protein ACRC9N_07405 [Aeromonas sp.]
MELMQDKPQAIASRVADVSLAVGALASMLMAGNAAASNRDVDSLLMGIGASLMFATEQLNKVLNELEVLSNSSPR